MFSKTGILFLICLLNSPCADCQRNGFISSISDAVRVGATIASRFINSKPSSLFHKITERMKNLEKENRSGGDGGGDEFIPLMLRMMGIDSGKVKEFAFGGLISLVHLMRQVLVPEKKSTEKRSGERNFSLFRFILSQPQVADLVSKMQEPTLSEQLLNESKDTLKGLPDANVECILVLLCKMTPFVEGMQKSLNFFMKRDNVTIPGEGTSREKTFEGSCDDDGERKTEAEWEGTSMEDRMYFFVPSLREVVEYGDRCDQLFPNCDY